MDNPLSSIPDVAEQLMREFEERIPVGTITETVLRVSRDGAITLATLAEMARDELASLVSEAGSTGTADAHP
ncbi:MAG: hypothetical protein ACT4QF_00070 [Sporichthyaceae bacterium]|jgi:hypothetical protein